MSTSTRDFHHPSVCQFCKSTDNLIVCESCKTVSYCSNEHQKVDWAKHKSLCEFMSDLEKIFTVELEKLINNRLIYLSIVVHCWKQKMKRDMLKSELNMVAFRRVCIVCNARNCPIQCKVCSSVFYCCGEHQKIHRRKHESFCQLLKISLDVSLFNYKNIISVPQFTVTPIRYDLTKLPLSLWKLADIFTREFYVIFTKQMGHVEALSLIDSFSPVANIIFGLEKANLLKNRKLRKTKLVVHIIGADEEEQSWNWGFLMEFIFHWIKNLKKLTVAISGPNINPLKNKFNRLFVCGSCNMSSSNAIRFSVSKYYHDTLAKPDMVVGFNCGIFSLSLSCAKSIPKILKHDGVPLLLTNYTLDWIKNDLNMIKNNMSKKLKIIVKPQRNPFSCLSPEGSVDVKRNPVHYKNAYITLIVTK